MNTLQDRLHVVKFMCCRNYGQLEGTQIAYDTAEIFSYGIYEGLQSKQETADVSIDLENAYKRVNYKY